MRAVIYDAVGSPLRVTEVEPPACPADGVVVEVRATGVCRSDWHAWRGHDPVPLPHIPGHEFAGVVAEVGPGVSSYHIGDRVTAPFVNGCGRCEWCRVGQAQVCPDQTQPGFTRSGSFAERVVVDAAELNLVRLPEEVDFVTAAALGCRFATAFHALTTQAELAPQEWLVVYGCGGVGLSAVMIGAALGARVVAIDPSPTALARAGQLGADVTVAPTDPEVVRAMTGGGAHVSVDALGSEATADASVRSLRPRGRHVQVGLMLGAAQAAPLPWGLVVSRELRVVGSHGMSAADYPAMLAMIADGRLAPQRLLSRTVDLDQVPEALMAMDAPVASEAGIVVATIG